jgi:hypothetical protein
MVRTTTSPGVEANAQLHLQPLGAAHLLGVAPQLGLHRQGRVAGPHGVVLMRHRGAEEGHDPIAQHLVDRAFVTMDGVHHAL